MRPPDTRPRCRSCRSPQRIRNTHFHQAQSLSELWFPLPDICRSGVHDKQATVKVDATAIVQMHNEFRDTPKTGDDFNLGLWVSLAALSVVGAGVLGFVSYKNRKKKKED